MNAMNTILYPTDFSKCSDAAIPLARSLARDSGAKLILLHVSPLEVIADGAYVAPMDPRVYQEALEELRERLEGPDLKLAIEVDQRQGDPATEILVAADAWRADLIVMGTHGRGGLGRLVLGSVAEAVMRHADCPVLTVKTPHPGPTRKAKSFEERATALF